MPTPWYPGKQECAKEKPGAKRDPEVWWRRPLPLILLISLGVHVLLLLFFGGTVLFRERISGNVFQAEAAPTESRVEQDTPEPEEATHSEITQEEAPPREGGMAQEAVPVESVVRLPGESGWAPPVRGEGRVPVAGFSGKGPGRGKGKRELFGTVVGDKKLGVIVDVSGSMQPYLERVMTEVFDHFPGAEVVLVDGCGMLEVNADAPPRGRSFRSAGRKKRPRREMEGEPAVVPHVVGFDSKEGLESPAVGGAGFAGGLRQNYPRAYETLLRRTGTWIVVGDGAEAATRLAFEHLAGDRVQAIYWFSDFEDPVETGEGERAAQCVRDNKIDVYLHPIEDLKNIRSWAGKVGANVIEVKL